MAKVHLSVEFDSTENPEHLEQLVELLRAFGPEAPKAEAPETEAPKAEAPKTKTAPLDEEAPKSEKGVTLAALRVLLAERVGSHRLALKDKLRELGAATVSTLGVGHYDEFYEFMQSLK